MPHKIDDVIYEQPLMQIQIQIQIQIQTQILECGSNIFHRAPPSLSVMSGEESARREKRREGSDSRVPNTALLQLQIQIEI